MIATKQSKIIKRKDAKQQGLTKYFTGKPCKYGHLTQRLTSNCKCIGCIKVEVNAYKQYPHLWKHYAKNNPEITILSRLKSRAKKKGIPFNLEKSDITIPIVCPILGIPISPVNSGRRGGHPNSLSVDRIIPKLGYVKGNIIIISMKANRVKNDATLNELKLIYQFYKKLLS